MTVPSPLEVFLLIVHGASACLCYLQHTGQKRSGASSWPGMQFSLSLLSPAWLCFMKLLASELVLFLVAGGARCPNQWLEEALT